MKLKQHLLEFQGILFGYLIHLQQSFDLLVMQDFTLHSQSTLNHKQCTVINLHSLTLHIIVNSKMQMWRRASAFPPVRFNATNTA